MNDAERFIQRVREMRLLQKRYHKGEPHLFQEALRAEQQVDRLLERHDKALKGAPSLFDLPSESDREAVLATGDYDDEEGTEKPPWWAR